MKHHAKNENTPLIRAALALLAAAILGASYLLVNALIHGPILGCGEGSGCDSVLKSRFAYLLPGVPVTVPALLVYVALVVCILRRESLRESGAWRFVTLVCALLIVGAAAFFIGIQAIKLKQYCPYCMATHLLGSAGAILAVIGLRLFNRRAFGPLVGAGMVAGASLAAMVACQYFFPQKTYVLADAAMGTGKTVGKVFAIGETTVNLDHTPYRGNIDSEKIMVILFDYTCGSCRTTHRYLHRAEERFGADNFLIVGIPVPLNPKCNPAFTDRSPQHADACEHARLALALWKLDQEAFREWDHWMFESGTTSSAPSPADALAKAESLVDPSKLKSGLADPSLEEQIARNIEIWKSIRARLNNRMTMPQMIVGGHPMAGAPGSEFALFDILRDQLKLEPVNP